MSVVLQTTLGDLTIELFVKERPRCSLNFIKLCKMKYYNFCPFFKIEKNFAAQSGDPTRTGRGGDSVFYHLYGENARYFEGEKLPKLKHTALGTVSMVNNGEGLHGSQFFITLAPNLSYLDKDHTVFARVVDGFETLVKFNETICDDDHKPYRDVLVMHTIIKEDPFDDPSGLLIPSRSPSPTEEMLKSDRIGVNQELDENAGKSMEEVEEAIKDKEAKARAYVLEMIGDIPTAEVKPPDNVLFVCKLNPVTKEEDLEVIFSRFGPILSCEVIKDQKSGESLQYAFIEFEKPEDCEKAYFKMDNVLIDDRRIHVDFSQSVSKIKWKGKGKGVELLDSKDEKVSYRDKRKSNYFENRSKEGDRGKGGSVSNRERQRPTQGRYTESRKPRDDRRYDDRRRDEPDRYRRDRRNRSKSRSFSRDRTTRRTTSHSRRRPKTRSVSPSRSKHNRSASKSRHKNRSRSRSPARIEKGVRSHSKQEHSHSSKSRSKF